MHSSGLGLSPPVPSPPRMSEVPIRPGIGSGGVQTFEELLQRNLSMDSGGGSSSSGMRRGGGGAATGKPSVRFADTHGGSGATSDEEAEYTSHDEDSSYSYTRPAASQRATSFSDQFRALDPSLAASPHHSDSEDAAAHAHAPTHHTRSGGHYDDDESDHFEDGAHEEHELHYDDARHSRPPPSRLETSFPLPSLGRGHPLSPLRESSQEIDTERLRYIQRDARDEDSGVHDEEDELAAASDDGGHGHMDDDDEPRFQTAIYHPSPPAAAAANRADERRSQGAVSDPAAANAAVNQSVRQEELDEFERLEAQAQREAEIEEQQRQQQQQQPHYPQKRLRPSTTQLNNSLTRQQLSQLEQSESHQSRPHSSQPVNPYTDASARPSAAHSSLPVFDDDEEWTDEQPKERGGQQATRPNGAYGTDPPAGRSAPARPATAASSSSSSSRYYADAPTGHAADAYDDDLEASDPSYSQIPPSHFDASGRHHFDADGGDAYSRHAATGGGAYADEDDEYEQRDPLSMAQIIPSHATAGAAGSRMHAQQQQQQQHHQHAPPSSLDAPPQSSIVKKFFGKAPAASAGGSQRPSSAPAAKKVGAAGTGVKSGSNKKKPAASAASSSSSSSTSHPAAASSSSSASLSTEVARYQSETLKLKRLNKEQEAELNFLKNEVTQARAKLAADREELERQREEEAKKNRAIRLQLEKERRALSGQPDRREREMIDSLTRQVAQLQEELQVAHDKARAADARARKEKEALAEQVRTLKADMAAQEARRLDEWEARETAFQAQVEAQRKREAESKRKAAAAAATVGADPSHFTPASSVGRPHSAQATPAFTPATGAQQRAPAVAAATPATSFNNFMQQQQPQQPQQQSQQPLFHPSQPYHPSTYFQPPPAAATSAYAPPPVTSAPSFAAPAPAFAAPAVAPAASSSTSGFSLRPPPSNRHLLERGASAAHVPVAREVSHPGGKVERFLSDGSRLILFKNATSKRIFADGLCVVSFPNGDRKHTETDGRVLYFYAAADTTHTTYPDGTQLYEFANRQIEQHMPDGRKTIYFNDGTVKHIERDGTEEARFPDGTVQRTSAAEAQQAATQQTGTQQPQQRPFIRQ